MSYLSSQRIPAMGYIQATAVSGISPTVVNFDIPNDMQTGTTATTDLLHDSIVIMRLSRSNDGVNSRSTAYAPVSGADLRYRGRIPSEVTNYMQASEDAFTFGDSVRATGYGNLGTGNIDFTDHSHCRIWRSV